MTQKRIFKVYVIKHNDTIVYAGLTRQTLIQRFHGNVARFKLDKHSHRIELVSGDLTLGEAVILESMLIKQYDLINKGLNSSPGSINGYSNYHSEEQKLKWKQERRNKKVSPEHAEKNKVARLGKNNSKEHNEKISLSNGKRVICIETGTVYKSTQAAAKHLNLHASKISLVCTGKRFTTGGYHFKYLDEAVDSSRND